MISRDALIKLSEELIVNLLLQSVHLFGTVEL